MLKPNPTSELQQVQSKLDEYVTEAEQMNNRPLGEPFKDAAVFNSIYIPKPPPPQAYIPGSSGGKQPYVTSASNRFGSSPRLLPLVFLPLPHIDPYLQIHAFSARQQTLHPQLVMLEPTTS